MNNKNITINSIYLYIQTSYLFLNYDRRRNKNLQTIDRTTQHGKLQLKPRAKHCRQGNDYTSASGLCSTSLICANLFALITFVHVFRL